jgi:Rrf2 family cysteine metabolism transcriptional repressor
MKLSTKGRYATRAMVDLALNYGQEPIVLSAIARRQGVSEQYLEQLIGPLKVAGLVRSIRGPNGGFMLAKSPSLIRISDIIWAVEGSTALVECVDDPQACSRADDCLTRSIWVKATEAINSVFDSTTLQDLVDKKAAEIMLPAGSMRNI